METDYYLFVLADQNLKPLKQRFKELGAFFTGIGYAFPKEVGAQAAPFCQAAGLRLHRQPLPAGHTFASFELSHKASFFKEREVSIQNQITALKETLSLNQYNNTELQSIDSLASSAEGKALLDALENLDAIRSQIVRAEKFAEALAHTAEKPSIRFIADMPKNLLLEDPPEMPRLVNVQDGSRQKPFLRKGILAMLVGAGGVGKTHALTQLAFSLATGYPWLGLFPIEKPGHVFLGLGENRMDDIHRLLRKTVKHFVNTATEEHNSLSFFEPDPLKAAASRIAPMSFSGVNAAFIHQGKPTAYFQSFVSSLIQAQPSEGWSCIILDPISRFIGMDAETDNASATQFIALLEHLCEELRGNPTIVFGHHMNKSGIASLSTDQGAARGSSAITDGVRWQVNLERKKQEGELEVPSNEVVFRHVKSNFTELVPIYALGKSEWGSLFPLKDPSMVKVSKPSRGYIKIGSIGGNHGGGKVS